jgi:hypothetical protein
VDLIHSAGLYIQDVGVKQQFNTEFRTLQQTIEQSVSDGKIGCLLKIRLYLNPDGAIDMPGGTLISFEETGTSPLDALAKSRMSGGIVTAFSLDPPFANQSYYLWIKKENGVLKAGVIPSELRESFEKEAENEVQRRRNIAKVYEAMESSGMGSVVQDSYWSDLSQTALAKFRNEQERRKAKNLMQEFAAAQRHFEEAYEQFSQKEQELRDEQQKLQMLQTISRIGTVVSSAIQLGELASTTPANSKVSASGPANQNPTEVMINYHEKQIDSLTGNVYEWGQRIDLRGASLQQINNQLVKTFKDNGISTNPTLVIPRKP